MTKKRFRKLTRAYFTRLNEWAKQNHCPTMKMGELYRTIERMENPIGCTRAEWWRVYENSINFGVGVKVK